MFHGIEALSSRAAADKRGPPRLVTSIATFFTSHCRESHTVDSLLRRVLRRLWNDDLAAPVPQRIKRECPWAEAEEGNRDNDDKGRIQSRFPNYRSGSDRPTKCLYEI